MVTNSVSSPRPIALTPIAFMEADLAAFELTQSQYDDAKASYEAVADVLKKATPANSQLQPTIRHQGSMRLGTTVRPLGKDRFDLDMLCRLDIAKGSASPGAVFEWVWEALGTDATYRSMRKRKNRCIRLDYAESRKFDLDVTPVIPDGSVNGQGLYVPDRARESWCSTNPIAYADEWFMGSAKHLPRISVALANERVENRARVEPMPEYEGFHKKPLQRIVQLAKRDRDLFFQSDQMLRPTSILLTTLVTHSYMRAVKVQFSSLLDFVCYVAHAIPDFIDIEILPTGRRFHVVNPVNKSENFAEKWTDIDYAHFIAWHQHFTEWLSALQESRGRGVDVMLSNLSKGLGKENVTRIANSFGANTSAQHQDGQLKVSPVFGIGLFGASVPVTINHGKG